MVFSGPAATLFGLFILALILTPVIFTIIFAFRHNKQIKQGVIRRNTAQELVIGLFFFTLILGPALLAWWFNVSPLASVFAILGIGILIVLLGTLIKWLDKQFS